MNAIRSYYVEEAVRSTVSELEGAFAFLAVSETEPGTIVGARKRLQGGIYYLLDKDLYILDEADSGLNFTDYMIIVDELRKKKSALIIISHDSIVQSLGVV